LIYCVFRRKKTSLENGDEIMFCEKGNNQDTKTVRFLMCFDEFWMSFDVFD